MRKVIIAFVLVGGCGGSGPANRQASAPAGSGAAAAPASSEPEAPEERASLVGLWEGAPAAHRDQLCLVRKAGKTQFGVVTWGPNLIGCSGAGEAERKGDSITLRMTGDSACTIEAGVAGDRIVFRQAAGAGCANYYCGHGVRFEGARFTRQAGGAAAARKATDIAGDPLCG